MTGVTIEPSPSLDELESNLRHQGYTVERSSVRRLGRLDDEPIEEAILLVDWPSGKGVRRVIYDNDDAEKLKPVVIEDYRFLGDLDGLLDVKTGTIESRLAPLARITQGPRQRLSALPGVEELPLDEGAPAEDDPWSDNSPPWRLRVSSGAVTIELSPASDDFKAMFASQFGRTETIKISGMDRRDHDSALEALEVVGRSFLLDLDLRYGTGYGLFERGVPRRRANANRVIDPPVFPRNRYSPEPLALYSYGRSAAGLPLLEYLAYYQSVEFYFPIIAQEDTVRAVGAALRDPRFSYSEESDLRRLISLATPNGPRGRTSERDQLRLTIRNVMDVSSLRAFIESSAQVSDHLCAKAQTIKGVDRIQLDHSQTDLRDQVADRIYAIRCRIVHTKDDGGDSGIDLLLPSSREARSLGPDVDLVRLVAEQTLVSRATPLGI